jgi:hypothetical protein
MNRFFICGFIRSYESGIQYAGNVSFLTDDGKFPNHEMLIKSFKKDAETIVIVSISEVSETDYKTFNNL